MVTLNRDIQQLNLVRNNITSLSAGEFYKKKFRNLQKIYLNSNQLSTIHSSAFYKLTGLIELDLSENYLTNLSQIDNDNNKHQFTVDELMMRKSYKKQEEEEENEEVENDEKVASNNYKSLQSTTKRKQSELMINIINANNNRSDSFLQDLSQLRQLNLASNQLSRLEEFIFSPLIQLRQLYLSR